MLYALLATGIAFSTLALVFWPLEKFFPAKEQKLIRRDWHTDFLFFCGQYLIWNALVLKLLSMLAYYGYLTAPAGLRNLNLSQPMLLQIVEVLLLSDLCIYWVHRLQHRVPFLWQFHKVHHTMEHLDWVAAHREHPVDSIVTQMAVNLPVFALGFDVHAIAGVVVLRGIWTIFIHSNVAVHLGVLKFILGSPELHHWHHAKGRDNCNYGNLSPLMDVAFGTLHCSKELPRAYGINEPTPRSYFRLLLHPFAELMKNSKHPN